MWWKELSYAEIMSMHGVEIDDPQYNEENDDYDDCDHDIDLDDDRDSCPRCGGRGCNWCLMTEW